MTIKDGLLGGHEMLLLVGVLEAPETGDGPIAKFRSKAVSRYKALAVSCVTSGVLRTFVLRYEHCSRPPVLMKASRDFLRKPGLPAGDVYDLATAPEHFDRTRYRFEMSEHGNGEPQINSCL